MPIMDATRIREPLPTGSGDASRSVPGVIAAVCLLVVALATVAITFRLDDPYWSDEQLQVGWVVGDLHHFSVTYDYYSPPLYSLLLMGWIRLLGATPASTALLSVAAALAALVALYRLGELLFDRTTALVAAAVFWVSAANLGYATETRMYALLVAASLWSVLFLHRWVRTGSRSAWWGYLLATVIGAYTHYSFWFLLYAQNLAVAWGWRRGALPAPTARRWIGAQAIVALAFLPWLPLLARWVWVFYLQGHANWVSALYPVDRWTYPLQAVAGFLYPAWSVPGWVNGLWASFAVGLGICLWASHRHPRPAAPSGGLRRSAWATLGFLVVVPLAVVTVAGAGVPRYVIYTGPFAALLLAAGVVAFDRRFASRWLLTVGTLGALALWNLTYEVVPPTVGHWSRVDPNAAAAFWASQASGSTP